MEDPIFFRTSLELRSWFEQNHSNLKEVWVGFYKKHTGIESITWSESVDQALCFGWIDGIRKRVNEQSYKIRFTPRNPKSHWSAINLEKIKQLKKGGLLEPAGLKVYNARDKENAKRFSYEQEHVAFTREFETRLKANDLAYSFFRELAPSYRKASIHWVMSAKRDETKQNRFEVLLTSCLEGKKIPLLRKPGE